MPAAFVTMLCGYREGGQPNTSDASDKFSVELGNAYLSALGVARAATGPSDVGSALNAAVVADLSARLQSSAPDLSVLPERKLDEFEQYAHLKAIRELIKDAAGTETTEAIEALESFAVQSSSADSSDLMALVDRLRDGHASSIAQRRLLLETLGEESVLGLDVAISRSSPYPTSRFPHLAAGLSLKWSLRTDRAQDCRSQGAKMAALRRGRMPHFAAVTMEPRPYYLAILGRGSGDLDCVYHLHLPALSQAIDAVCAGPRVHPARRKARDTFRQLCDQGRLRDYDDLVSYTTVL